MADSMLERIRAVAGSDVLPDLADLDPSNDLHVDEAASALLERFRVADDADAFRLLVVLTADRLAAVADEIAADVGLGTDCYELVTGFYSRLFVDLRPRPEASLHFLGHAADRLREDAETVIRDLALQDVQDPETPTICEDGRAEAHNATDELVARAARIGFHRLETPFRRVLRAKDTAGLGMSEIATRMGVPYAEVEELLQTARERLARAIDDVLRGPS